MPAIPFIIAIMTESKYVNFSAEEKNALEEARDRRFGEGRRVTLGAFARILSENYLNSVEGGDD